MLGQAEQGAIEASWKQPGMRVKTRAWDIKQLEESNDRVSSDPLRRGSGVRARAERIDSAPPQRAAEPELPLLSIGTPVDDALLEPTYAYISAYCFAVFPPPVAQRLNVAVYELLANALHHATRDGEARLELRRHGAGAALSIRNIANAEHRKRLALQVERVQEDPSTAFNNEMSRFAGGSQPPPMVGIVRVAHEAGLELELRIEQDTVELSTVCE